MADEKTVNHDNKGVNKLAQVFQGRIQGLQDTNMQVLDFGTVQPNMSLVTDKFPLPIPANDYMVCRSVTWGKDGDVFAQTQSGGAAEYIHDIPINEKVRSLMPGDRVLVAWVGDDACVIDLILPAAKVNSQGV